MDQSQSLSASSTFDYEKEIDEEAQARAPPEAKPATVVIRVANVIWYNAADAMFEAWMYAQPGGLGLSYRAIQRALSIVGKLKKRLNKAQLLGAYPHLLSAKCLISVPPLRAGYKQGTKCRGVRYPGTWIPVRPGDVVLYEGNHFVVRKLTRVDYPYRFMVGLHSINRHSSNRTVELSELTLDTHLKVIRLIFAAACAAELLSLIARPHFLADVEKDLGIRFPEEQWSSLRSSLFQGRVLYYM